MWWLLITFMCGAAYEFGCVFWVHHSEQGNPKQAAFWSIFNALVTCIGLSEALNKTLFIVSYALGFGCGTYLAVKFKHKLFDRIS